MKYFLILFSIAILTACGGGSNVTGEQQTLNQNEPLPVGGSPNNPTEIALNTEYGFSNDNFSNYFRHSAVAGEKLIIHVELNSPLSDIEKSRCAANDGSGTTESSYDTQIHVYDSSLTRVDGRCGEKLIFDVPTSGVYLIRPDYQSTNSGSIFFSSIIGNSSITAPYGPVGKPSNPAAVSYSTNNVLSSNPFNNYFYFTATSGQKFIVNTLLNTPLSVVQRSRCAASGGGRGSTTSGLDTQIHVYDDELNRVDGICGEYLEFDLQASGSYILHFDFAGQSAGVFNAALVNALVN